MKEEKKNTAERQTKAGLMNKNGEKTESEIKRDSNEGYAEDTPKISKEKAEDQGRERPLH